MNFWFIRQPCFIILSLFPQNISILTESTGCFYTGCKKLMQAHKYFACGSLVCMGMAIYSGHKIAPKKKKAEKPEK